MSTNGMEVNVTIWPCVRASSAYHVGNGTLVGPVLYRVPAGVVKASAVDSGNGMTVRRTVSSDVR